MKFIDSNVVDLKWAAETLKQVKERPTILVTSAGGQIPIPAEPSWLKFYNPKGRDGVSWMHNVYLEFPEFVERITDIMSVILGVRFNPQDFMLIRTVGPAGRHIDTGPELCRVNIGLENTTISSTHTYDKNGVPAQTVHMKDGEAWLLDPRVTHSVSVKEPELHGQTERFLATLAIFSPYHEIVAGPGERLRDNIMTGTPTFTRLS